MKKAIGILVLLMFLFSACRNNSTSSSQDVYQEIQEQQVNTTLSYVKEAETLNELLRKQEAPVQKFQVLSSKPSKITGQQGTVVHIRPGDLETIYGQPVGDKIDVELKECTHQEALLRSNVQTVSNGQLLVSGGAYYINMTSDGKQLKIKNNKTMEIEFPKLTEDEMELFYGQRDSLGRMNWLVADKKLEKKKEIIETPDKVSKSAMVIFEAHGIIDTVKNFSQEEFEKTQVQRMAEKKEEAEKRIAREKEEAEKRKAKENLNSKLYNSISVNRLGWINVDRFLKTEDRTELIIEMENEDATRAVAIYLVFKDINSVLNTFYYPKDATSRFFVVPVGRNVRLIAVAADKDGSYYSYSCDFTIKKDEKRSIKLQKTDDKDWNKLFDLSNWCGEVNKAAAKITVVN